MSALPPVLPQRLRAAELGVAIEARQVVALEGLRGVEGGLRQRSVVGVGPGSMARGVPGGHDGQLGSGDLVKESMAAAAGPQVGNVSARRLTQITQ